MLMAVKNQIKISLLSIKYAVMKEMLNKVAFISDIVFMLLNNASFIVQWLILFSLKESIGGYTFKEVLLLWGIAASTYGFAHFFFKRAFELNELITTGKLDSYLVQPKNVLLSCITSDVSPSAIGDLLYGPIILIFYGMTLKNLILLLIFTVTGGTILVCISVILCSLSFWFTKSDLISDAGNSLMVNFATYPDGIFKGVAKLLLYTLVPVGIANYLPVKLMVEFNIYDFLIVISFTVILIFLAFYIFNRGLKRYSSGNLMSSRI